MAAGCARFSLSRWTKLLRASLPLATLTDLGKSKHVEVRKRVIVVCQYSFFTQEEIFSNMLSTICNSRGMR